MKLTLLLIPLILLSSCTIDWNDEKDAKIVGLEKQIQEIKNDDSFKRNQECANLAPELSKQVNELNIKNRNMNPGRGFGFEKIFFSKGKNQCFYIVNFYQDGDSMKYGRELFEYGTSIQSGEPIKKCIYDGVITTESINCREFNAYIETLSNIDTDTL